MNLLCLVAHPDDETILCGGTLAMLASKGVNVHIACLTRGEGGELGEPPLTDRAHLGDMREREMLNAVRKLRGKSLTFLDYVDPMMRDDKLFAPKYNPTVLADQIVSLIKKYKINVVLTHGSNGEYGHPAHILINQTIRVVVVFPQDQTLDFPSTPVRLSPSLLFAILFSPIAPLSPLAPVFLRSPISVYTFSASFPNHPYPRLLNKDDPTDFILDVSPFLSQKESAAMCHKTQHALFVRRRSEMAGRQLTIREVMVNVESLHRMFGSEDDELTKILEPYSVSRIP